MRTQELSSPYTFNTRNPNTGRAKTLRFTIYQGIGDGKSRCDYSGTVHGEKLSFSLSSDIGVAWLKSEIDRTVREHTRRVS